MKKLSIVWFLALLLIAASLPVSAYAADGVDIIDLAVTPENGRLDLRLRVPAEFNEKEFAEDAAFSVLGVDVHIATNGIIDDLPVGYIMVIDRSGYYTAYLKYDYVKAVALQIIQSMDENDRIAVVFVDSIVESNSAFMLKSAASTIVNSSVGVQSGKNSNAASPVMLYQGISKALQLAGTTDSSVPAQRAIIVLSDFGAEDPEEIRLSVLQSLNKKIPLITVPFWCNGYEPSNSTREAAQEAAKTGRSELLGYAFQNAEIVIQQGGELDSNQVANAIEIIDKQMNFAACSLDITALYQAGKETQTGEVRIDYLGSTGTATVSVNPSAIATPQQEEATPTPTATATPDPNPIIIQFGDENADVLKLQHILSELYYYIGELHRKFDTNVQVAMMEFCVDHGLEFSDVIRADVWEFIQSDKVRAKTTPTPEPVEAVVTPDPNLFLQYGDKDAKVYNLQRKLLDLGYLAEEDVTTVYDDATQLALYSFCEENGLEVAEGVTVAMWNLLQSGNALPKPTATPEPTPVYTPEPTRDPNQQFANGDEGGDVRTLQNYLISHYYLAAEYRTGIFDANTQWAVDEFCAVNGLQTIDDGMSVKAWELMQSGKALAKATEIPETPTPEPTRDPQMKLLMGDSNDQVIVLQRRLAQMYYLTEDDITGVFDQQTMIAVVTFCEVNGMTDARANATSGMSNAAWNLLMAGAAQNNPTATPAPTATPTEAPTLAPTQAPEYLAMQMGDSNAYVRRYQQRLVELGYLTEEFTAGTYDEATQAAQNMMCDYNNLMPQSGADEDLQQFAFSATIKNMNSMGFGEKLRFVLMRTVPIGTLEIPVWIFACAGLLIFLVLIVVVLVMPGKKRTTNKANKKEEAVTDGDANPLTAEDAPTGDLDIDTNVDVPTDENVNVNNWQVTLTIAYMGTSSDAKYTMVEGVPIRIGRRIGSTVVLNAEDVSASRDHAQLVYRGKQLYYRDTSKLGSIVDGEPLHQSERMVRSGSVIEISRHRINIM